MHMGGTNHRKLPGPAESAQTVMDFAVAAVLLAEFMPPIRQPKPESRRLREGCPILSPFLERHRAKRDYTAFESTVSG